MKQSFKLSYCDYIANIIQKSLMQFDQENLLDKIGRIRLDLDLDGVVPHVPEPDAAGAVGRAGVVRRPAAAGDATAGVRPAGSAVRPG